MPVPPPEPHAASTYPPEDGRRARSRATRERLLRSAAQHFARSGFDGTTLDEIARAAEANPALIAYHFGGKQGLYSEVLREAIRLGLDLLDPVRRSEAPAADQLSAFVQSLGELLERRPHFAPMIVREWMSGGAHFEPEIQAEFVGIFQVDRELLARAVQSGEFRDVDPHSAHLALVGSLVFFHLSAPVRERFAPVAGAPSAEAHLELVQSLFLRGLAAREDR